MSLSGTCCWRPGGSQSSVNLAEDNEGARVCFPTWWANCYYCPPTQIFFNFTFQCTVTVMDSDVTGSKSETTFRRVLKILRLQAEDWVTVEWQCCRMAARSIVVKSDGQKLKSEIPLSLRVCWWQKNAPRRFQEIKKMLQWFYIYSAVIDSRVVPLNMGVLECLAAILFIP